MKLDYNVRVTFFPKDDRPTGKQAFYRLHLQIEGRKILYLLTNLDPYGRVLDADCTVIYDGSRTYWASRGGKGAMAVSYPGFSIEQFLISGVGLPFFGFDYPGLPYTKLKFAVPAGHQKQPGNQKPALKRFVGQMLVADQCDHTVIPPIPKYTDLVGITKDAAGRVLQCGLSFNGVPVDLWTLNDYRTFPGISLPMRVRHQVGYIPLTNRPGTRVQVRLEDIGDTRVPGVVVRKDYETSFEFISTG
jgi:hypothetical protein